MNSLIQIGKKYPTSKNISGFIELYESFFKDYKDKNINILEIGVDNGDSLRVWREYFSKAKICGIDIIKKDFKIPNVEILCGNQTDPIFLNSVVNKYKNFAEVSNFMSQNKDEWPTDERGFIDWELLEKDGHV